MFRINPDGKEKNLRALSEKDIQRQLYGEYLRKAEDRVEVMDSAVFTGEKEGRIIEDKFDARIKKEVSAEIQSLNSEFKRLKDEVNRLRKDKESLERSAVGFKPPFVKIGHLVMVGSAVIFLAIGSVSFFSLKFIVSSLKEKKLSVAAMERKTDTVPKKNYTIQAYTSSRKEDAEKAMRLLSSKNFATNLKETKFVSGKAKFVIYVGEFSGKKEAEKTIKELKEDKQFKDSFLRLKQP
ncbi:MAG: SPOR domain-containing protein [Candidatus Omnitrophota bacterium]